MNQCQAYAGRAAGGRPTIISALGRGPYRSRISALPEILITSISDQKGGLRKQRGVAAVEFAMVSIVFFTILFGIAEMGRLLWTWNAATEATRLGARLAVVCSMNDGTIKSRMRQMLPALRDTNISIDYLNPPNPPNSCTTADCKEISVSLTGYTHRTIIPFIPLSVSLPPFQTTLPREYMESSGNPVCN